MCRINDAKCQRSSGSQDLNLVKAFTNVGGYLFKRYLSVPTGVRGVRPHIVDESRIWRENHYFPAQHAAGVRLPLFTWSRLPLHQANPHLHLRLHNRM